MGRKFVLSEWPELVEKLRERLKGKTDVTLNDLYEMMDREIGEETIRVWIRKRYIKGTKKRRGSNRTPYKIDVSSVLKFLERFDN